jgi:ribosomal protein S3
MASPRPQTVYGKIGVKCWICKKEADANALSWSLPQRSAPRV